MDKGKIDRYDVTKQIEETNFATVYKVVDREGKTLALKIARQNDFNEMIIREFEILSQVKHPNVVQVLDCGRVREGQAFFTLEYVDGLPMNRYFKGYSKEFIMAMLQIIEALGMIHEKRFVHCDLKPEHMLFVPRQKKAVLIDFGFARELAHRLNGAGTIGYIAPEVLKGIGIDTRADLFSLGVILYEILAGSKPKETFTAISGLATELNTTIAALLSKEPAIRPSIIDLHAALSKYLPGEITGKPAFKVTLPRTGYAKTELFDGLATACGKAVVICGESGMGKTRLLKELKFKFLTDGHDVLFYDSKRGTNLLEEFGNFVGCKVTDFSRYENQLQIYDGLLNELFKSAERAKKILIIDDVDDLSDYELGLVRYIGHGIRTPNILMVIAARSNVTIENLGFEILHMKPFTHDEIRILLEKTFWHVDPIVAFNKWLCENSGGNPLFVVEILNNLFHEQVLYYENSAWHIEIDLLDRISPAKEIEDLLIMRLARLNESERTLLQVISLCNSPLNEQILDETVRKHTHIAIESLKAQGLLKDEVVNDRIICTIPNRILKTIVDDGITKHEKKKLRSRILGVLEGLSPDDPSLAPLFAELCESLNQPLKSSLHYLKAAQTSERKYDYDSALKYYTHHAKIIRDANDKEYSLALLKIANINQLLGNSQEAIACYQKCLEANDVNLEKEIHLGLGFTYSTVGDQESAVKSYKKAIALIEDKKTREYIQATNYLGYALLYLNKHDEAGLLFGNSLALAHEINDLELQAESQYYQATFEWFKNNYDTGIEIAKKNLEFASAHGLTKQHAYAAKLLASLLQQKNDPAQVQSFLDKAIAALEKIGHINALCGTLNDMAIMRLSQGDLTGANEAFRKDLVLARQINSRTSEYIALEHLGIINRKFGNFNAAITLFEKASGISADNPVPAYEIAMILLRQGKTDKAKSLLETKYAQDKKILFFFGLGLIETICGNHENAEELVSHGLERIEKENPDTDTKVEAYTSAAQCYFEKGDFASSMTFASQVKELTYPLGTENAIAQALIKINEYNLRNVRDINIDQELDRLKQIGCIYDWAWLKRMRIESILRREIGSAQIKSIAEELTEIELVFKPLGAELEISRCEKIKDKVFPLLVRDYARKTISAQYLETFTHLAKLISEHLGDKEFVLNILDLIIQATSAERGALFLNTATGMEFAVGRNMDQLTIRDAGKLTKTAVEVIEKGTMIFCADAATDPTFSRQKSVMVQQIHSLLCVPLSIAESVIGAIYLDSRVAKGIFESQDKDFLLVVSQVLASVIEKSLVFKKMIEENIVLKTKVVYEIGSGYLIGKSKPMIDIYTQIEDISATDTPILITGETGTGKGMIARFIHLKSRRKDSRFLTINCGTITETLFESELFGHKKGSFTGAINDKKGLLEEAEAGTVFLDEISNTSIGFQAKLLEAIEEKLIRRVGETNTIKVDVRFLFATNKDLEIEVEEGRFRKDLFYRINVFKIDVPALRDRDRDTLLLARFFLDKYAKELTKEISGFSSDALVNLKKYSWPGNVRELQNTIERAVIRSKTRVITSAELGLGKKEDTMGKLQDVRKEAIIDALAMTQGNIQKAAKILGINRKTIHRYLKKYGIEAKNNLYQ